VDKNIKNFPDDLNKKLRIEAAEIGCTIKDLIICVLENYYLNKPNNGDVATKKSKSKE